MLHLPNGDTVFQKEEKPETISTNRPEYEVYFEPSNNKEENIMLNTTKLGHAAVKYFSHHPEVVAQAGGAMLVFAEAALPIAVLAGIGYGGYKLAEHFLT